MLLMATSAPATTPNGRLPDFSIEDQYKREWSRSDFLGSITVFMISDRSGYEYNDNWLNILLPRFQTSVRFVPVADVQIVPGFLKPLIRSRFKDSFTYPILMDWDGQLVKAFNTTSGLPNLVLVGRDGTVVYSTYGKGSREQIERLARKLEEMLTPR